MRVVQKVTSGQSMVFGYNPKITSWEQINELRNNNVVFLYNVINQVDMFAIKNNAIAYTVIPLNNFSNTY